MTITITKRWSPTVVFTSETAKTKGEAIKEALAQKINLSGSNLSGSDLSGSDLQPIRDDIWAVLSSAPAEVEGLRLALIEGRVNGSTYTGECACLVGTIANVRGCGIEKLPLLRQNSRRPAERFFLGIAKGDTPSNNPVSKMVLEWVDQWLENMKSAFSVVRP